MGSSGAVSEIVESKEDLDLVRHFKGSSTLSIKVKAEDSKSQGYPVEDDLNRLMKAIDSRTSSRAMGSSRQMGADMLQKSVLKKPAKVGASQASGIGISESVTLKQALRKLCISQASEMAAMKRLSKPTGLSDVSEAGTIKRLLASVVVPTSESGEKGNLVEISLVPENSVKDLESSNQSFCPSPNHEVSPTTKVQKTRIQDIIASTEAADDSSALVKKGVKGKAIFKNAVSSSKTGVESSESTASPYLIKPVVRNKTNTKKKGKQESESTLGSSSKCSQMSTSAETTSPHNLPPITFPSLSLHGFCFPSLSSTLGFPPPTTDTCPPTAHLPPATTGSRRFPTPIEKASIILQAGHSVSRGRCLGRRHRPTSSAVRSRSRSSAPRSPSFSPAKTHARSVTALGSSGRRGRR